MFNEYDVEKSWWECGESHLTEMCACVACKNHKIRGANLQM